VEKREGFDAVEGNSKKEDTLGQGWVAAREEAPRASKVGERKKRVK